eukprot:TRINITY_DN22082_c0_g1_i1.p1 TRINITY_DN22082_c0_g1~~TRINITY_DN22082_c0_g1_i1.p1  ORF type:complete len:407 (-),score=37.50 TRINITY_DN22082_c0_g1_i1:243-1463(-)
MVAAFVASLVLRRIAVVHGGIACDVYEVCRCEGPENALRCGAGTCSYAPGSPLICCNEGGALCDDPDCETPKSWEDCEWANYARDPFSSAINYGYPGQSSFMSLPDAKSPLLSNGSAGKGVVVLTDVDDTIECSGGPPGGADTTCIGTQPKGMYPGIAEFQLAIARGPSNIVNPSKVVPLSARPDEAKRFLAMKEGSHEDEVYKKAAKKVGITDWGLDVANAQYGSVVDISDFAELFSGGFDTDLTPFDKLGYRKYVNWNKLSPMLKAPVIFVGDNGQGDLVAGQMMLKRSADMSNEGAVRAVFIHDVRRVCTDCACRRKWAQYGIFMFKNYADAASTAMGQGLITADSCANVCSAAPTLSCNCSTSVDPCTLAPLMISKAQPYSRLLLPMAIVVANIIERLVASC